MLAARNHRAGCIPVRKINKIATVKARTTGPVAEIALMPASDFDSGPIACGSLDFITSIEILMYSFGHGQGCLSLVAGISQMKSVPTLRKRLSFANEQTATKLLEKSITHCLF